MRHLLILILALCACSNGSDEAGPGADAGDAASASDGFNLPGDAADSAVDTRAPVPPGIAALCAKRADPLALPGTTRCLGDLAKATFLFAECSCTNITVKGCAYGVDGVNTAKGGAKAFAAVGANGRFSAAESGGNLTGSIWAAGVGAGGLATIDTGTTNISGDVHCGGNLTSTGAGSIARDAYVTGATNASLGSLRIEGKLHQPATSPAPVGVTVVSGVVTEPVSVPEPCNCSNPLPIASYIEKTKTDNDNAALGLTATSLADDSPKSIDLGCGRFYFDQIKGQKHLRVFGPTAIYVAGDVDGAFSVQVEPGGQIDVFVGGNFHLRGGASLGSSAAPANSRFYIAGSSVTLEGAFNISANVYAVNAAFDAKESAFQIYGSLYAREITVTGSSHIVTYDQSVQELTGCQPPGGGCSSCHDCGGATPACKGGTCAKCTSNADCCAPLVCQGDGVCRAEIR